MAKRKSTTTEMDIAEGLEVLHDLAVEQDMPTLAEHLNWLANQARYGDLSLEKLNEIGTDAERREYTEAVTSMAEEAAQAAFDGNEDDEDGAREALQERVREDIDGSHWIIYNSNNFQVLRYSDNAGYAIDEGLINAAAGNVFAQLAYVAMEQDVIEEAQTILERLFEEHNDGE